MADGIEEEKLGNNKSLHQHDRGGGNDCEKSDDVHHTDGIKNDIPWPSQAALDETHLAVEDVKVDYGEKGRYVGPKTGSWAYDGKAKRLPGSSCTAQQQRRG